MNKSIIRVECSKCGKRVSVCSVDGKTAEKNPVICSRCSGFAKHGNK